MKLAIDGGPKAVTNMLAGWPSFSETAIRAVEAVLRSGKVNYWTGSRGSILAEGTIGQNPAGRMTAFLAEPGAAYDAAQRRTGNGGIAIDPPAVNTYRAEIEEFSAAVLAGREPAVSARLGVHSQEVLAACYRSAKTFKRITL